MKKTILAILLLPMSLFAELPARSQDLIDKLNAWEIERKIDLQKEIKAKRTEVVRLLEAQLKETTKTGDLDAALEIKKEIEKLSEKGIGIRKPKNDDELAEFVRGTSWGFSSERILTFQEDGTVLKSWGKMHPKWTVEGMKLRYEAKVLTFDDDFTELTEITKKYFDNPGKRLPTTKKK